MMVLLPWMLMFQVEGLRPEERFLELAPRSVSESSAAVRGRVVDAATGRPVPGALVEVWTEEIDPRFGGFHRTCVSSTGADGRFALVASDAARGEKARVSAPGYVTRSCTTGDLSKELTLFPAPRVTPRLRVVDSRGLPLPAARITTTYSCAHDAPAFDLRTGADGVAHLAGFGLQDDVPELRVRAPGHLALFYHNGLPVLERAPDGRPATVSLPRCTPFAFRLVDRDGAPRGDVALIVRDGDGYHVTVTDTGGTARIDSRYGSGDVSISELRPEGERFLAAFPPLPDRTTVLRAGAEDWPDETPLSRIVVEPAVEAPLWFFHERGWIASGDSGTLEVPAGNGTLVVGGAFEEIVEELHDVVAAADETLRIEIAAERALEIELEGELGPEREIEWLEAGAHTLVDVDPGDSIRIPKGTAVRLGIRGRRGDTTRVETEPFLEDATIDLDQILPLSELMASSPPSPQMLRFLSTANGEPLPGP